MPFGQPVLDTVTTQPSRTKRENGRGARVHELAESRGGRPGFPEPNSPSGLCGRKAALNVNSHTDAWSGVTVPLCLEPHCT